MDESNAKHTPKRLVRLKEQCAGSVRRLREWAGRHGRGVPRQFLHGAAYQVGSGAVTLLILWWETRH